jgi:hypothetical protein
MIQAIITSLSSNPVQAAAEKDLDEVFDAAWQAANAYAAAQRELRMHPQSGSDVEAQLFGRHQALEGIKAVHSQAVPLRRVASAQTHEDRR